MEKHPHSSLNVNVVSTCCIWCFGKWTHCFFCAITAPKVLFTGFSFTHSLTNRGCCYTGCCQLHVEQFSSVSCPRTQQRTKREQDLNGQCFGHWTSGSVARSFPFVSQRRLSLFRLPVIVLVAVELGQRQLLQLDLQVLVFPLQVHNHAVQEVDLMGEDESENRQPTPGCPFNVQSDFLTWPSANSFSSLSCSRAASPAGSAAPQSKTLKKNQAICTLIFCNSSLLT